MVNWTLDLVDRVTRQPIRRLAAGSHETRAEVERDVLAEDRKLCYPPGWAPEMHFSIWESGMEQPHPIRPRWRLPAKIGGY